ncbi:hypothetical protein Hbl1158_02915 [Halobaculum sp. CBA1158]|uniref:hypothetical protein n=1 Tax=Halobaculum sp. CBA1158 TaxID=2904243 RepID=UPI001F4343EB|nr:hypothetical protein [Halobaculum sp. CBA1158]UIP00338.1 hypothetical protein Hbl1158_02915 [Halobaculum sp. CBA1158]
MTPTPKRPYRALRSGVGALVVATIIALWAHGHLTGDPLGTTWDIVVVALVLASGYAVFGRATMSAAVDEAQQLTEGSDSGSGEDGGDDGDA